jgi:23S rRNA (pseudouridine1915-N3)-methyltransferase
MKLVIVAVGHRMPAWVDAGFGEYARRMPRDARLALSAIKPVARGPGTAGARLLDAEGKRILASVPRGSW